MHGSVHHQTAPRTENQGLEVAGLRVDCRSDRGVAPPVHGQPVSAAEHREECLRLPQLPGDELRGRGENNGDR